MIFDAPVLTFAVRIFGLWIAVLGLAVRKCCAPDGGLWLRQWGCSESKIVVLVVALRISDGLAAGFSSGDKDVLGSAL